jgi:hypothetical protein
MYDILGMKYWGIIADVANRLLSASNTVGFEGSALINKLNTEGLLYRMQMYVKAIQSMVSLNAAPPDIAAANASPLGDLSDILGRCGIVTENMAFLTVAARRFADTINWYNKGINGANPNPEAVNAFRLARIGAAADIAGALDPPIGMDSGRMFDLQQVGGDGMTSAFDMLIYLALPDYIRLTRAIKAILDNNAVGGFRQIATAAIARKQGNMSLSYLTYNTTTKTTEIMRPPIPANFLNYLQLIGKTRFDTYLVRNLVFITNLNRVLRLKLNRELTQNRAAVVSSHTALAMGITDYGQDPFDANDVLASTTRSGRTRYNDAETLF